MVQVQFSPLKESDIHFLVVWFHHVPLLNIYSSTFRPRVAGEDWLQSIVLVQHPTLRPNDALIQKGGELWQDAAEWGGGNPRELACKVAKLHYVLDNTMRFVRGSAAITEWVTEAIYHHHGFASSLDGKKSTSLVQRAMSTVSLSEFTTKYLEAVTLTPIAASKTPTAH